jgi:hypothetical protein
MAAMVAAVQIEFKHQVRDCLKRCCEVFGPLLDHPAQRTYPEDEQASHHECSDQGKAEDANEIRSNERFPHPFVVQTLLFCRSKGREALFQQSKGGCISLLALLNFEWVKRRAG